MKLFKRDQDTTDSAVPAMPPELNNYYQAEKRQHALVTWGLGLVTLAVTIALAFVLFLGARWVVGKFSDKPSTTTETAQNEETGEAKPAEPGKPAPAANTPSNPGPSVAQTPTTTKQTPQTSSATTALPNTGPTETLEVFLIATTAGMFAYKLSARRN